MPENRLIVVANRLPVTLKRGPDGRWETARSGGGLATAMVPILRRTGGIWIGWSGASDAPSDPERSAIVRDWEKDEGAIAIDLPAVFYEGYPNRAIWPLFHYFPASLAFDPGEWRAYVDGNRRYCDAVVKHARPGDRIWIHDYHLMLLPRMLRDALPDAHIGFFLHIPFPASDIFALLPRREEVLEGLLGADLIGFHTHQYVQHFRDSLLRLLAMESRVGEVEVTGRTVRMAAFPIGIAPEDFRPSADSARRLDELRRQYEGQRVLVSVDRLDYTKGIPERLRAFRRLLDSSPQRCGKVTLIQVAVPSREGIDTYQDLRSEVHELVGETNGKLGTPDWTPIIYIHRSVAKPELVALYRLADVAWVTPIRDGMNLVAKEYAASKPEGDGVLVLSEFAGAAVEMGEALLVNPLDEERTAEAVARALDMDPEERRYRMRAMYERVTRNDVYAWGERFLAELDAAAAARSVDTGLRPRALDVEAITVAYRDAVRRLLLLDYDGTLVPFTAMPHQAAPPASLLDILAALAEDPANCTAIVSGRSAANLERWFGAVPRLLLAAEHGAKVRANAVWSAVRPDATTEWKEIVRPILEHSVDRTPGSFVEEKEFALVWHYRMADPEFGEWLANELVAMLEGMLAQTELRAFRGHKIVEVKPTWANKGQLCDYLLSMCPEPDFTLAVGDDRTDEDMFARLQDAWTVHVGRGETRAHFTVPGVSDVGALLRTLAGL